MQVGSLAGQVGIKTPVIRLFKALSWPANKHRQRHDMNRKDQLEDTCARIHLFY